MATIAATAALGSTVDAIVPRLVNAAVRNAKYPFKVGDNVKALQRATKELLAKRDDVKTRIDVEERQGGTVKKEVSEWLEQVGTIEKEVGVLEEKYQSRYRCLGGFQFNCQVNYTISKKAVKLLLEVQNQRSKGVDHESMGVTQPAPPPSVQEVPMEPTTTTFSTADYNLEQALKYINHGPEGVIGLSGMGGVGKTHLLERINNSYLGDSSFDVIVFVTASKECSIAKIQASIVEKFKLLKNPNEEQQKNIIFNFLKIKKFLLLLDDIWEKLDLREVGIPFPLGIGENYKRKVVLTTRSSAVCGEMRVNKEIKVACLNKEESRSLFLEKVGSETIDSHPLIPSLAQNVIDELGGLPLALITIGGAMYGKKDPVEWEYAIDQLRAPSSVEVDIFSSHEGVYQKLKLSYDILKSTRMKQCFLSCSMWPEDYAIDKEELIKNWIGLGYIKEFSIKEAYRVGHVIIGSLLRQCLLEEGSTKNTLDLVKMHDVIRDMAHWIACDFGTSKNKWVIKARLMLKNLPNNRELWHDAECVSLMLNDIKDMEFSASLSSPSNLTSLMLGSNYNCRRISFSKNISYFTRLRFLDLSHNGFAYLSLDICKLVSLQYLDLTYNNISTIPSELKFLINLKFLFMGRNRFKYLPEGVISELKLLEVLDLYSEFAPQYNPSPSFLEEIKCLENLKALGIILCDVPALQKVLSFAAPIRSLNLSEFKDLTSSSLSTKSLFTTKPQRDLVELTFTNLDHTNFEIESIQFPDLEMLGLRNMEKITEITWRGVLPVDVFPRLKKLALFNCNLEHITWIIHLPCLQMVTLMFCEEMKELVRSDEIRGQHLPPTFPSLKVLIVMKADRLERICDPNSCHFPSLTYLKVNACPELKQLPFPNVPPSLQIDADLVNYQGVYQKLKLSNNNNLP